MLPISVFLPERIPWTEEPGEIQSAAVGTQECERAGQLTHTSGWLNQHYPLQSLTSHLTIEYNASVVLPSYVEATVQVISPKPHRYV